MIHLYAEHLLNIRTLTISAKLTTHNNKETSAVLSAGGSILTLTHEGECASITLPINISPNKQSDIRLTIPAVPSEFLSFRLSVEEKRDVAKSVLSGNGGEGSLAGGNLVPWCASRLSEGMGVWCGSCGGVLVERGAIRTWKDLPSEGWAEMMEFWHCHKPPDEGHDGDDAAQPKKGYSANSQLNLEAGVGLVDPMAFIFEPGDCKNVEISKPTNASQEGSNNSSPARLACTSCKTIIGDIESSTQGYKLNKLKLSLSSSNSFVASSSKKSADDCGKWFACLLLCAMENQGVRKFVVRPNEVEKDGDENAATGTKKALKLWVFTPDMKVSSSTRSTVEPVRVAKVMWRDVDAATLDNVDGEAMNGNALAEGELRLWKDEVELLREKLVEGGKLMPEHSREFQEWNVGLLERFVAEDLEIK